MKKLLILLGVIVSITSYGQLTSIELPQYFGLFFDDPHLNPAIQGSNASAELYAGHRRNSNNFGGIHSSFAAAYFDISNEKNGGHIVGIELNNDKEGIILKRNRFYGLYGRHLNINEDYKLGLSASIGAYNFNIVPNYVTQGISKYSFDGNVGVYLYSDKLSAGFSINQFNASRVIPVDQIISLARHYTIHSKYRFSLMEDLVFTPLGFIRLVESKKVLGKNLSYSSIGFSATVKEIIHFGSTFELNNGIYAFLGINNIPIQKNNDKKLNVDFGYFIPNTKNSRTNIGRFEITLKYFSKK